MWGTPYPYFLQLETPFPQLRDRVVCNFVCSSSFVNFDHFGFVFSKLTYSLVFSVSSQKIGWEERLRDDLFCVEWDISVLATRTGNAAAKSFALFFLAQNVSVTGFSGGGGVNGEQKKR